MAKLAELADEGNHVHVASRSRRRLNRIARKAKRHFGLSVREFPPYDVIDCVHTSGSWHYRRRPLWWVARSCPRTLRGRTKRRNLAMDVNGPKQRQFFEWVLKTYGRPSGWFQP